jgi:hypothetical protein
MAMADGEDLSRGGRGDLLAGAARKAAGFGSDCAEVAAISVVKAGAGPDPEFAGSILMNGQDIAIEETLLGPQTGVSGAIELVKAVLSAGPHDSGMVLQKAVNGEAVQALSVAVLLKGILLRGPVQDKKLA